MYRTGGRPGGPLAVSTAGLTKRFGDRTVVDDVALAIPAGSVCGFVGPNGAGKTTTIRMLLGLVRPTSGSGTILGGSLAEPATYLRKVGALIESPAFYPQLSGRDNLKALARLGQLPLAAVDPVLERSGLPARAGDKYRSYSLGMKQRLGIAAATARRARAADPRRADQRPRPGGHRRDARPDQVVRRRRDHGPGVQPPDLRDRADLRLRGDDPGRPARPPGERRRAAGHPAGGVPGRAGARRGPRASWPSCCEAGRLHGDARATADGALVVAAPGASAADLNRLAARERHHAAPARPSAPGASSGRSSR